MSTNGAKTTQNDDGWKVATGNELKLSSESITHCPNHRERSRAASRTREGNHEVVEQIKLARKVGLKNTLSLPVDIRNARKKDTVPKYTILRRDMEPDLNNEVEATNVLRITEIRLCSMVKTTDANGTARDSSHDCKSKSTKTRKHTSSKTATVLPYFDKAMQTVLYNEKSVQANVCVSMKHKQIEVSATSACSPKRTTKVPSKDPNVSVLPSISPSVRKNPKKQTKTRLTYSTNDEQEKLGSARFLSLSSQEKHYSNGEKLKHCLDVQVDNNYKNESIALTHESDFRERKKKVSRIIREMTKRRCDKIASLFMMLAKITGLSFLYYIIIVKYNVLKVINLTFGRVSKGVASK